MFAHSPRLRAEAKAGALANTAEDNRALLLAGLSTTTMMVKLTRRHGNGNLIEENDYVSSGHPSGISGESTIARAGE